MYGQCMAILPLGVTTERPTLTFPAARVLCRVVPVEQAVAGDVALAGEP